MTIEDWMGSVLFLFGLILITLAFLSAIAVIDLINGMSILGFSLFGFLLCLTGFVMARTVMGGVIGRFRR